MTPPILLQLTSRFWRQPSQVFFILPVILKKLYIHSTMTEEIQLKKEQFGQKKIETISIRMIRPVCFDYKVNNLVLSLQKKDRGVTYILHPTMPNGPGRTGQTYKMFHKQPGPLNRLSFFFSSILTDLGKTQKISAKPNKEPVWIRLV